MTLESKEAHRDTRGLAKLEFGRLGTTYAFAVFAIFTTLYAMSLNEQFSVRDNFYLSHKSKHASFSANTCCIKIGLFSSSKLANTNVHKKPLV